MKNIFPTCLVILDGFGYREEVHQNAIMQASMPSFSSLLNSYPWTILKASGQAVGLPYDYPGNSEIGHFTIGCGVSIKQPITLMEDFLNNFDISDDSKLKELFLKIAEKGKTLHILGLFSDHGVYSLSSHLFFFLKIAKELGIKNVIIHPFLDVENLQKIDTLHLFHKLEILIKDLGIGSIGSIHGRFYAMDFHNNWHLTKKSYEVLIKKNTKNKQIDSVQKVFENAGDNNLKQEFIEPVQLDGFEGIQEEDSILCFNFKSDQMRQLTQLFVKGDQTGIKPFHLQYFITPISYGFDCPTTALFSTEVVNQTLMGMLNDHGYTLYTIAEFEKYPQVTYFFNGGREEKYSNETRKFITSGIEKKSNIPITMQADVITQVAVESLQNNPHDFYLINYANADVIGHTGDLQSTIQAVEYLDKQIQVLFEEIVIKRNGILCITSDHGNAENMLSSKEEKIKNPHTTSPVYFVVVQKELEYKNSNLPLQQLSDIAPFIAHMIMEG